VSPVYNPSIVRRSGFFRHKGLLNFYSRHETFGIGLEKKIDLFIRETFMKLTHGSLLNGAEGPYYGVHFSNENGSVLN
jgi:hypothetical protein